MNDFLSEEIKVKQIGYFCSFAKGGNISYCQIDIIAEFYKPLGWKSIELKYPSELQSGLKVDLVSKKALKKKLKNLYRIKHTHHCSPSGFLLNIFIALAVYSFYLKKPGLGIQSVTDNLLMLIPT